jgi:hypothetical protein
MNTFIIAVPLKKKREMIKARTVARIRRSKNINISP